MIQLNYRDARPIYQQILEGFRSQIQKGILEPGDRLPSVRELAANLSINPNTIARAYRELEIGGWIATVPGKGCFVCGTPAEAREEQSALLGQFDALVASLEAQGFTRAQLISRLGGEDHA